MANTFDCPNCGQKLTAKPEMAGAIIDCPSCGSQIQVPAFEAPVPMASQQPQQPYPRQMAPSPGQYGYSPQPVAPYPAAMREPSGQSYQGMAITAFVLSFIPLVALVGLILGIVALNGMKKSGNPEGKGLATAAVCISAVVMGIVVLWVIVCVIFGVIAVATL